jgi:hypothetical protein
MLDQQLFHPLAKTHLFESHERYHRRTPERVHVIAKVHLIAMDDPHCNRQLPPHRPTCFLLPALTKSLLNRESPLAEGFLTIFDDAAGRLADDIIQLLVALAPRLCSDLAGAHLQRRIVTANRGNLLRRFEPRCVADFRKPNARGKVADARDGLQVRNQLPTEYYLTAAADELGLLRRLQNSPCLRNDVLMKLVGSGNRLFHRRAHNLV